ncbi:dienelactone hydrolase [Kineosphaera limosa]|uniref:Putative peptidase S9 family protein n=1 Tax=Kineosphaera limosa NBRC 100340 TaxID=1184609 RepID=K6VED5_9MICO|nr:prolyl oligopeptidase family serine peptidase [Kineosphaera limosa]NYD99450.1 dienelactone hydrolase [Kineosphaera limosa]GAB94568.1 putative peptidase S9 family protein [Kineosphaera limosa NBRC 100340]
MTDALPYGAWPSPVGLDLVVQGSGPPANPVADDKYVYWLATTPTSGSRVVLMRRDPDARAVELTGPQISVRSRVHEYGGGEFAARGGIVAVVDDVSGSLLRVAANGATTPLTPAWPGHEVRYGAPMIDLVRQVVFAVREDHCDPTCEPVNEIVRIPLAGGPHEGDVIVPGRRRALDARGRSDGEPLEAPDFVLDPVLAPGGRRLAWVQWSHPAMPWTNTQIVVADLDRHGSVTGTRVVAGRDPRHAATEAATEGEAAEGPPRVAATEPVWVDGHRLAFLQDPTGYCLPYLVDLQVDLQETPDTLAGPAQAAAEGGSRAAARLLVDAEFAHSEFGLPAWTLRQRCLTRVDNGGLVGVRTVDGVARLCLLAPDAQSLGQPGVARDLSLDLTAASRLAPCRGGVLCEAGFADRPRSVTIVPVHGPAPGWRAHLCESGTDSLEPTVVATRGPQLPQGCAPTPEPVTWAGHGAAPTHGFLYRPTNPRVTGPADARPPLIVISHGGPTAAAAPVAAASTAYFTSRGLAVLDVNYGGSTGFGRAYRQRLDGQWGVVDVEDCVRGAVHLADSGVVDGDRMAICGGSAGGFTTLSALTAPTASSVFSAGISLYGVGDLTALAHDTHKFESRYLDGLVGPWPQAQEVYRQRSPIAHADRLACPLLLLQGTQDKVVPPEQAHVMAGAVRAKDLPVALVLFEGEGHGFREPANVIASWQAQTSFLAQVWGYEPADDIPRLPIENLP